MTNVLAGLIGFNQAITLPSGGANTDYLRLAGLSENDILFTGANDVLNLNQGGLIHNNNGTIPASSSIGSTAVRGVLTAGGTLTSGTMDLVIYDTANTTTTVGTFTGAAANATVSGSNVLTLTSTANIFPGMGVVLATTLPAGTAVTQVLNSTQVLLNNNATAAVTRDPTSSRRMRRDRRSAVRM